MKTSVLRRLRRAVALHGVRGALLQVWRRVGPGSPPPAAPVADPGAADFDSRHGVDTTGVLVPDEGEVVGDSWLHGVRYQGVSPEHFHAALGSLALPPAAFTFVDFGCGKGRAVLLAAGYPFRQIIGVEYAPSLANLCRQNVARFSAPCPPIEIFTQDAATFDLPPGPLVLFFYNPFGRRVMARVLANIEASFRRDPRPMILVYLTPVCASLLDRASWLRRVRREPWLGVYQTPAP